MVRTALVMMLLVASIAAATPKKLSLPVGHSMTMAMPNNVKSVRVSDPSMVEVKHTGRRVTLVARSRGLTEATVTTTDGEHQFRVYVAEDKYALPQ